MGRFEDEVFGLVDEGLLAAGVAAPEEKDEVRTSFIEILDDCLSEGFPAVTAMRAGFVGLYGEDIIEQEDTLSLPVLKIAGGVAVVTDVGVDFFIDVDERRWDRLSGWHGKGETVCGAGSVVGVLAEDDNSDFI